MRQFLPVVIDAQAPPKFVRLIRELLEFSYLAHGAQISEVQLTEMKRALVAFHDAKKVLVDMDMVTGANAFNRIAKLHMIGHYAQDIRELGTPDGYSTKTPEHLHIVYVKIPWRMSNRRNPMPQIIKYVRRTEALELQRTLIDEYYGEQPGADIEEIRIYDYEESSSESDSEEEEDDSDSNEEDQMAVDPEEAAGSKEAAAETYYPSPVRTLARRPTVPRVPGHVITSSYGATDFIRALRVFLSPIANRASEELVLLPSDRFDIWHKVVLSHAPLPFAASEPPHRDVIRARPPQQDLAGRTKAAGGVFDTALFAANRHAFGLERKSF